MDLSHAVDDLALDATDDTFSSRVSRVLATEPISDRRELRTVRTRQFAMEMMKGKDEIREILTKLYAQGMSWASKEGNIDEINEGTQKEINQARQAIWEAVQRAKPLKNKALIPEWIRENIFNKEYNSAIDDYDKALKELILPKEE